MNDEGAIFAMLVMAVCWGDFSVAAAEFRKAGGGPEWNDARQLEKRNVCECSRHAAAEGKCRRVQE